MEHASKLARVEGGGLVGVWAWWKGEDLINYESLIVMIPYKISEIRGIQEATT